MCQPPLNNGHDPTNSLATFDQILRLRLFKGLLDAVGFTILTFVLVCSLLMAFAYHGCGALEMH